MGHALPNRCTISWFGTTFTIIPAFVGIEVWGVSAWANVCDADNQRCGRVEACGSAVVASIVTVSDPHRVTLDFKACPVIEVAAFAV